MKKEYKKYSVAHCLATHVNERDKPMEISQQCFSRIDAKLGEAVMAILQRSGENATQDCILKEAWHLIQPLGMPEASIRAYLALKIEEFTLQDAAAAACTGE